jgi:hypothetical protein
MKLLPVLVLLLMKVISIRPDAASVMSDFTAMKDTANTDITTSVNDMINVYLARGTTYATGHAYLRTNIINRLMKLHGTCIWAARQISKVDTNTRRLITNYFQFDSLRLAFSSFDSIQDILLNTFLTGAIQTFIDGAPDDAKLDSCWAANKAGVQQVIDDFMADLDPILSNGPTALETTLAPIEAQRLSNFQAQEAMFQALSYQWKAIGLYVFR